MPFIEREVFSKVENFFFSIVYQYHIYEPSNKPIRSTIKFTMFHVFCDKRSIQENTFFMEDKDFLFICSYKKN
jgi:hypothetical protein